MGCLVPGSGRHEAGGREGCGMLLVSPPLFSPFFFFFFIWSVLYFILLGCMGHFCIWKGNYLSKMPNY